ncbi:efflux RND transporter periplasmic adaptor subunit [Shewanella surugensis]|uniref:HlyD family efflux transporter periplasmic adaptor subunit n=1 Tax=Shewanella surugensis TaxID=212020 RepID=A0ABT0L6F5_9GAMM|nr:HlyD family efflux transporter periplasmic adaptor subunit [Shewanella surugensis]MCL1123272.1 HlyD family efflux transporter periplasmic adaptor subunit [Shewanella surugensis]
MIKDTSGQDKLCSPNKTRKFVRPLLVIGGGLLVTGLVWLSISSPQASFSINAEALRFATLEKGTLVRDISTTGIIVAANAPVLYSPEMGSVTLALMPGDHVKKGEVIARIESHALLSQFKQQGSVLEGMKSALERAKLDARRQQLTTERILDMARVDLVAAERESRRGDLLIKSHLISEIDFEAGKDTLQKAELLYAHSEKEVALMKDTLSFEIKDKASDVKRQSLVVTELTRQVAALELIAPVSGIIGNWLVEQNARVSQGQALFTVVDLSAFEAELAVPETYADELGLGMTVVLNFGAVTVAGTLSSISPEVINREVSARVRFTQDDSLHLRQNQRLSARVLLENKPNVLMVKQGAFVRSGGGQRVYVVQDNIAKSIPITLGARSMSHVEVLSGGLVGDRWVISSLDPFKKAHEVQLR